MSTLPQLESDDEVSRLRARVEELEAELKRCGDEMDEKVRLFEEMLETVPVGVVIADARGEILFGNKLLEDMVGHPVLRSKDADSYEEWVAFHPDGRQVQSREYPLARVYEPGVNNAELEAHYQRPDGSRFWMRIIGQAICDGNGHQLGAAVAVIDVDHEHRAREAQEIMIGELNHRVKNAFSVTQAITNRTLRNAGLASDLRDRLDERLKAYAASHSRLVGTEWHKAEIRDLAEDVLRPIADDRIALSGSDVEVSSRAALSLSMAFYELATNAVKHGALSEDDGQVTLSWHPIDNDDESQVRILWQECNGPPVTEPENKGFGTFVLDRAVAGETGGRATSRYDEEGFSWELVMPTEVETHV